MSEVRKWHDNIEDVGTLATSAHTDTILAASIAISLKRIADALTEARPYENPISRAINEGISNGAQDWIGHMARNGR